MKLCAHTEVTKPECGCFHCGIEQVRRFAPHLLPPEENS